MSGLISIFRDKDILNNTLIEKVMNKKVTVFINFKSSTVLKDDKKKYYNIFFFLNGIKFKK